ncbi:MAG: peptidyl-prolyl cis-trans isomerase, partial [Burkholderiales bacterium]|nr:peptidyl-prolyl cis-trans isomerase [Burkholderiales bacterium]
MFEFVRNHTRLALGFMLLLIIPSFIFFGVQGYTRFMGGAGATVAKVDGKAINRNEWDEIYKRYLDQLRQRNPNVDPAQIDTAQTRASVLDQVLRERVVIAAADQLHLYPAPERMQRLFDSEPEYAGLRAPDGKLNRDVLAMQGMTVEMLEQRVAQELAAKQVLAGITDTVPISPSATAAAVDPLLQQRAVQVLTFDPASYRNQVSVDDAQIEAYYKSHQDEFKAPQQATIDYAVLELPALERQVSVTDADLQQYYDDHTQRYTEPEQRHVSHILIKVDKDATAAQRAQAKAKAEALLAELRKDPAAFADLARKNSEDPGSAAKGGDLDWFGRGAMVKPFEDAAFALQPGQISDVVQTDFGYHIITVTGVRGGDVKPFDAVRGEVEASFRRAAAEKRWAEAAEQFTNTVYEQSDSLQPALTKLKLDKQTATVQRDPQPGQTGPLASTKLLDAIFSSDSLKNKRNTDAIEVGPNELVAAHVQQYQPAHVLALAEVKDRVRALLVDRQAQALALQAGKAKLAAVQGGHADDLPPAVVASRGKPAGLMPPVLQAALRADASKLPGAVGVDLGAGGYAVLRVTQVLPRDASAAPEAQIRAPYAQAWAASEDEAYLEALKQRFKVEIKPG